MTKPISQDFDERMTLELSKQLKRSPTPNEIANSERDSDLVNEVLWQIIESLEKRISNLESNQPL